MSMAYIMKNTGPRTVPCGTLLSTSTNSDFCPSTTTTCFLPRRKLSIQVYNFPVMPYRFNLASRMLWSTLSKALLKSKYMTSTSLPSFKLLSTESTCSISCVKQLRFFLNPCWLSGKSSKVSLEHSNGFLQNRNRCDLLCLYARLKCSAQSNRYHGYDSQEQ